MKSNGSTAKQIIGAIAPPLGGPIESRYVADDVVDRLVTALGLGVYVDGQQLPTERELAAMLGVSRTSVRDALKQLTDRGYLEVRRGRNGGYFVLVDWGPDSAHHVRRQLVAHWSEFEHIFDARRLVEPMIARTAAVRRTKGDIAVMQAAVQAYIDAADRNELRLADTALHLAIAEATHNPVLVGMSQDLRAKITLNLGAEPYTAEARRTAIVPAHRTGCRSDRWRGRAGLRNCGASHFAISENAHAETRRSCRARRRHEAERHDEPAAGFIARRLLLTIPMLLVMSVVVFLIIRLVPGDPVRTMLGFRATEENVALLRGQLGLDRPLIEQYFNWAGALLRGDLGQDIVTHAPLSELLLQRLPVTFELTALSMLLAVAVGVPLGIRAATGGRWTRTLTESFVVFGISVPDFWLGIMLVLIFSATLAILPPSGYMPFATDPDRQPPLHGTAGADIGGG